MENTAKIEEKLPDGYWNFFKNLPFFEIPRLPLQVVDGEEDRQ